ncbi:VHS domain-containing protein, partial [Infundibulicybe gibba]
QIEALIYRACDPSLHEPNYALHLEVAEYINTKKANNPREAAMCIARLANHRNPHIAVLSLTLLDTLVQSCGYPFHLQISTKEFLNELVRRFPNGRPLSWPVMSRILDLIHGWKEGICTESRWREDLGNIRDMHRLLTFKGYRFRELGRQASVSPAANLNLKSADELEEEDREAQSAKLQELIRRGTPRDLAAAQELMKSLAGANPDAKPDYRTQALTDLNKLEQKVILMNEMLDNADTTRGERFVAGDAYDQVAAILTSARPKIQKWISDAETDDSESLDTFLQINDQINSVLNRYEAFKKGDYVTSSNPIPAELSAGGSGGSLIDFDDTPQPSNNTLAADDLASLFASSTGLGITQSPSPLPAGASGYNMGVPNYAKSAISPPQLSATPPASIMLPNTPSQPASKPNYFGNNGNGPTGPVNLGAGMARGPVVLPPKPDSPSPRLEMVRHRQKIHLLS